MYWLLPFLSQKEENPKKWGETKDRTRRNNRERQLEIGDSEQPRSLLKGKTGELKRNQVYPLKICT